MKYLSAAMTCLLFCALLSPIAHGMRSYSDSVDSVDALSEVVTDYEDQHFSDTSAHTVIVRTDGMVPDFRALHPQYTVQGPQDTYIACFSDAAQAEESMALLNATKGIRYAEPNGIVCAQAEPDTDTAHSWGVAYMQTEAMVEQLLQRELTEVTVAVVDSGIAAEHEQFRDRIVGGATFLSDPYTQDGYGHGTSVTGVAADCTAQLPVRFLIVKVLNDTGKGSLLNAANGIRYAAEQGAEIINISFVSTTCSQYLHDAVQYALSLDSLPVIAAGNYTLNMDRSVCCPSHMTEPIVVSGCDADGGPYAKSCYGSMVDVCAPAVKVECASRSGGYIAQSGTSFAAPHVSAVAAMYKLSEPDADCMRLMTLLVQNTKDLGDLGFDTRFGWGVPYLADYDIFGTSVDWIRVETLPNKTQYTYKDAFDPTGLTIRIAYDDGTQVVHSHGYILSGGEDLHRGTNEITVRYRDRTDTFHVEVKMRWWQWLIKILLFGWIWY